MNPQLARLLQLASPALPVGAYTYSQGLEWAVESGAVQDEASALQWIGDLLQWNMGRFEAPLLVQMMAACADQDIPALSQFNAQYLASRESAELRAETLQMAYSLLRLLDELQVAAWPARQLDHPTFPAVWAGVAVQWDIAAGDALSAYLWSWVENQTMAALKSVPLGQAAGQRILLALGNCIAPLVLQARSLEVADYSNFAPGFAIACSRHETQYTRLFRS
jgi:urease accessory protein